MTAAYKRRGRPNTPRRVHPAKGLMLGIYVFLAVCALAYLFHQSGAISFSWPAELWLGLAYGYWIAISFVLAQIGIGRTLFRLPVLRDSRLSSVSCLVFQFSTGFYLSCCFLTFIALFRWFNILGIGVYLSVAVPSLFLGFKTTWEAVFIDFDRESRNAERMSSEKWLPWAVGILFFLWVSPLFIQSLLPNTDWDGASCHLPLAKLFLEDGIFWVNPGFPQYNFPGVIHLVYSLFFALGAETAIIPLNFISAAGIILTVYCFAGHFWHKRAALWAVPIAAAVNILWEVGLTPRIDGFLAFFCLLAIYAFLLWIKNSEDRGALILTGMMLGVAMGVKYTAIFFVAILFPVTCVLAFLRFRNSVKLIISSLALMAVTLAIPSGWWYARNGLKLGDPLYPFLSERVFYDDHGQRKSIGMALNEHLRVMPPKEERKKVFGGAGLDFLAENEDKPLPETPRNLFNFWDIFKNPHKYQRKPFHEMNPFLLLFFLLPLFLRDQQSLWLYGITGFVFAAIALNTNILRYALPVFPLFSIGAALVLSRLRSPKLIIVASFLVGLALFRFTCLEGYKLTRMRPIAYLSGSECRLNWLTKVGYNWVTSMPLLIKFVNDKIDDGLIEEDSIMFMIGEGKGNLLKCKYLPDSSRWGTPWLEELINANNDYAEIARRFKNRGINYVVANYGYFDWVLRKVPVDREPLVFGLYHLQLFLQKYGEIIYNEDGIVLARLGCAE